MDNKTKENFVEIIESFGWSVDIGDGFTFSKFSPAGQDFSFHVNSNGLDMNELCSDIYDYYEYFDVSYETYLWLDNTGHGKNGVPYDMKDLYNDMKACEQMIYELAEKMKDIL